jgi:hypothetical protein
MDAAAAANYVCTCADVLQMTDATSGCYSFSLYWYDIMSLALMAAEDQPAPAAAAAARRLMEEKHSVFLAR